MQGSTTTEHGSSGSPRTLLPLVGECKTVWLRLCCPDLTVLSMDSLSSCVPGGVHWTNRSKCTSKGEAGTGAGWVSSSGGSDTVQEGGKDG